MHIYKISPIPYWIIKELIKKIHNEIKILQYKLWFFFQLNKQQFLKIAKTYWVLLDICSFLTRMVNSFQLLNNK